MNIYIVYNNFCKASCIKQAFLTYSLIFCIERETFTRDDEMAYNNFFFEIDGL